MPFAMTPATTALLTFSGLLFSAWVTWATLDFLKKNEAAIDGQGQKQDANTVKILNLIYAVLLVISFIQLGMGVINMNK